MSLCSRFQQTYAAFRRASADFDDAEKNKVSRHEMAAAREAAAAASTALNEVIELVKAEQVLTISSVEEVKFLSRSLPMFHERGALRRVVIRGSGNTRVSEVKSLKIRRALLAYGFRACEQMFDFPPAP